MPVKTRSQGEASPPPPDREPLVICQIFGDEDLLKVPKNERFMPPPTKSPLPIIPPSRTSRELTALEQNTLALRVTFATKPAKGSPTFVIGCDLKHADIQLNLNPTTSSISRSHLLLGFNNDLQVVVKDISSRIQGGEVEYQDDHYKHRTKGDAGNPPTWVIPPGRKVYFEFGALKLDFLVPDNQSYMNDYRQAVEKFWEVQNNPVSSMGGLGLDSQTLVATALGPLPEQQIAQPGGYRKEGRYAWITGRRLGEGSFGEVYEMFNSTTWEKCAGKKMKRASDFLREASLQRDLRHNHIARYIDQEIRNSRSLEHYLIMELCPLTDVGTQHKKERLIEDEVLQMFAQATSALQYLHENNVTHRDIKPGNILVRSRDKTSIDTALSDFGLSIKAEDLMSSWATGTYRFMAPEVVAEHTQDDKVRVKYSNKADIWSMGLVALDLLRPGGLPSPLHYNIIPSSDTIDPSYAHHMLNLRNDFLARPGKIGQVFAQLVADMIQWDPNARPLAKDCAARAAALLPASRLPKTDRLSDEPDITGPLNRITQGEGARQAVKRKGKDSSSRDKTRLPPKKPRQAAVSHAAGVAGPEQVEGGPTLWSATSSALNAALESELLREGVTA